MSFGYSAGFGIGFLRFGKCRNCGDPVKRRCARLCSSCWWAGKHHTNRQAETSDGLSSGRRVVP